MHPTMTAGVTQTATTLWLSPSHRAEDWPPPWSLELKIDLYDARVRGWQLEIADLIARGGKDRDDREVRLTPPSMKKCSSPQAAHAARPVSVRAPRLPDMPPHAAL
jgi:hypothetical protein